MDTMRISQLATRTGVPATTLRYYESAGLLPAGRTPGGYRVYGREAVDRLAFIRAAKHLGLPLEEIAELLTVWEAADCRAVKADLRPRVEARLAAAERRVAELAAFADAARDALARLDALPDRAGRCDPRCGFLARPGGAEAASPEESPAGAVASSSAATGAPHAGPADTGATADRPPFACALGGGAEAAARAADWRALLDGAARAPLPDGVRLTVPAARAGALAALAAAERRCCPFFDFRLSFEEAGVCLEVRAPAEAAELLDGLFGPAESRPAP
ncbi:DNA-binding transcriptional regulator, MerR family [Streptomyces zhaozhouensis]|uniref:DNA-binding transcriptional regulator, MerR family n=1 Tax=Streptomyces zhaozhouensis TaxID=1300267 RepID=A0A286DT00_9ACTN|nr:MerR family transcriptional regulator [Streptomyces zhaozhouensis]SOD61733.1 DNA-binding transcriptional regulator, MerR family [Streptomyces zhaozhouensis]